MKRLFVIVCTLSLLTGCSFLGLSQSAKSNDVVIAGGNTSERQILAEVVKQMVEHYEPSLNPVIINNLGSSTLIVQALNNQDANAASAMYTGTSITGELGLSSITDPKEAYETVVKKYHEAFNMVWFPSYGFGNTYAFMVRRDFAEEHNIKKVSDLEKVLDQIRVGIDTSWMTRDGDGYEAFQALYGFKFNAVYPMEISLVYTALNAKEMEVVLGYSTDGRIAAYDLVVLEDDLNLFPSYDASIVISEKLLTAHPELETIMLRLENSIKDVDMQAMNQKSDELRTEPYLVAKEFLELNNYFESVEGKPLSERHLYNFLGGEEE